MVDCAGSWRALLARASSCLALLGCACSWRALPGRASLWWALLGSCWLVPGTAGLCLLVAALPGRASVWWALLGLCWLVAGTDGVELSRGGHCLVVLARDGH